MKAADPSAIDGATSGACLIRLPAGVEWPQLGAEPLFVRHFYEDCCAGPMGCLKPGGRFVVRGTTGSECTAAQYQHIVVWRLGSSERPMRLNLCLCLPSLCLMLLQLATRRSDSTFRARWCRRAARLSTLATGSSTASYNTRIGVWRTFTSGASRSSMTRRWPTPAPSSTLRMDLPATSAAKGANIAEHARLFWQQCLH